MQDMIEKKLKEVLGKNINVRVIIDGEPMEPGGEHQMMEGDPKHEGMESPEKEKQEELGLAPGREEEPMKPMPEPEVLRGGEAGRTPITLKERVDAAKLSAQNMLKKKK